MKGVIRKLFDALGYEIRRKQPPSHPVRGTMGEVLRQLGGLGLRPGTVIDAGVAKETPELYEAFPESALLLIEPLKEFEPALQKICASRNAHYVLAAAGEAAGTAILNVHPDQYGSSLLTEVEGAAVDGVPREVPLVTLDDVCTEKKLAGPYLIKVDVQGAELRVLAGATRILESTEVVILETSLFGFTVGGPQLFDVVKRMKELGFVAYDLYGLHYRPLDGALAQIDLVFVREAGRFRKSHAYATAQQRQELFAAVQAGLLESTDERRSP